MGLDIYAGTLTRYYSHNWKTVVQQWAEENGYSFNRITPDGEPADNEEEMSTAEVQAAVENWRDQILSAISQPGQPPYAPWLEDNEKPYYTDKPDGDAFGAMLLVAACRTYEEPVPSTVEKDWIFGEHPLVARLASDEERVWSLFRGATWWLPLSDSFLFQGSLPTDDTAAIATLGGLRKELEKLNQLAWQADEDTILGWADTEGYPVDGTVDSDGQYSKADIPEHTQYDTQSLAKFAFSMFWRDGFHRSAHRETGVIPVSAYLLNSAYFTSSILKMAYFVWCPAPKTRSRATAQRSRPIQFRSIISLITATSRSPPTRSTTPFIQRPPEA
jgi:hypothetical protein